jgi:hypothetical protein
VYRSSHRSLSENRETNPLFANVAILNTPTQSKETDHAALYVKKAVQVTGPKPSEKLLQTGGQDISQSPRFRRRLTLRHAFLSWWRENLRAHGLFETTRILRSELWQFGREATPSRRKSRYGDIEFDCDYRVDTNSANVSRRMDLLGLFAGTPYQPCDPTLFHQTIRALNIDYGEFDFIDLGSGKGRALLMASDYPFRRILGVELLRELHYIAENNIRRYKSSSQQCFVLESRCGDAREFQFPPGPVVLFLFNPLTELGLRKVMANLSRSLHEHPRPVHMVYHNPILEHVLSEGGLLHRRTATLEYAIYGSA